MASKIFKIYIAAPFELQYRALILKELIEIDDQFRVIARWLYVREKTTAASCAHMDVEDIMRSEALVVINPAEWKERGTGGRHVELGLAWAKNIPIILYGEPSNVFHSLPNIRLATTPQEVLTHLTTLKHLRMLIYGG